MIALRATETEKIKGACACPAPQGASPSGHTRVRSLAVATPGT